MAQKHPTGLYNRRAFDTYLRELVDWTYAGYYASRYGGEAQLEDA